jgi:hypothetical protein
MSGTYAIDTTGDTIMAIGKDGWMTTRSLETEAFNMPTGAAAGLVLTSDELGHAVWAPSGGGSGYWTESVSASRIYTTNFRGIGRGAAENLIGGIDSTMTNFGVACTTGVAGGEDVFCGIIGGFGSFAGHYGAVVAGGYNNRADADYGFIGGGLWNDIDSTAPRAAIIGGSLNETFGTRSIIAGGFNNYIEGENAGIIGGGTNEAHGPGCVILGGSENTVYTAGNMGAILGGELNVVADDHSVVVGGYDCSALHPYCFVGGNRAWSSDSAQFVWSDNSAGYYQGFGKNTFNVRATGGAEFVTEWSSGEPTSGVKLFAGAGSWSSISDRNLKENFKPIDGVDVLNKIAEMPITTWNYKAQDETIRHAGPVAQDFYAAFGLGEDSTRITTLDASGIALAGVKELQRQVQAKSAEIDDLRSELDELRAIVQQLRSDSEVQLTGTGSRK